MFLPGAMKNRYQDQLGTNIHTAEKEDKIFPEFQKTLQRAKSYYEKLR
jgi:hypothetical protein